MSNSSLGKKYIKKFIFYNKKNKKILIIDGNLNQDKLQVTIYLKPHMVLYGVVKMISIDEKGHKFEYKVIGIDKIDTGHTETDSTTPYKIYLSKKF